MPAIVGVAIADPMLEIGPAPPRAASPMISISEVPLEVGYFNMSFCIYVEGNMSLQVNLSVANSEIGKNFPLATSTIRVSFT